MSPLVTIKPTKFLDDEKQLINDNLKPVENT